MHLNHAIKLHENQHYLYSFTFYFLQNALDVLVDGTAVLGPGVNVFASAQDGTAAVHESLIQYVK